MLLPDVNILVFAYREDATPDHLRLKAWLEGLANSDEAFALSKFILSSFIRIVTQSRGISRSRAYWRSA